MISISPELLRRAEAIEAAGECDYRFRTDGCSGAMSWLWWTFVGVGPPWEDACVVHDFAYWLGGTFADRLRADHALLAHVLLRAQEYALVGEFLVTGLAYAMYAAIRVGGGPLWPTAYRFGYRWRWPHGYDFKPSVT